MKAWDNAKYAKQFRKNPLLIALVFVLVAAAFTMRPSQSTLPQPEIPEVRDDAAYARVFLEQADALITDTDSRVADLAVYLGQGVTSADALQKFEEMRVRNEQASKQAQGLSALLSDIADEEIRTALERGGRNLAQGLFHASESYRLTILCMTADEMTAHLLGYAPRFEEQTDKAQKYLEMATIDFEQVKRRLEIR